jgi:hypothetical protein
MRLSQRKYRLPNHPVLGYNRYHDEDEFDRGEEWFILGLGFVIWGVYWGLVHLADKFTFNFIPWWIEPLTAFPVIGIVALIEVFGRNPLYWWPLFWGTKVKIKNSQDAPKISTEAEDLIEKLGGPLYVYMVDWETLKFRRKKDITKYVLFTSSDL